MGTGLAATRFLCRDYHKSVDSPQPLYYLKCFRVILRPIRRYPESTGDVYRRIDVLSSPKVISLHLLLLLLLNTVHLQTRTKMEQNTELKVRGRGRPKKGEIVAKKSKNRGTLGRPKGDKAIIDEYKARMLNSPKSAKVLETILNAALNDDHKNQAAAWKLVVDRIIPVSAFEQTKQGSGAPTVSINIMGLGQATTVVAEDDVSDSVSYDITDVEIKESDTE